MSTIKGTISRNVKFHGVPTCGLFLYNMLGIYVHTSILFLHVLHILHTAICVYTPLQLYIHIMYIRVHIKKSH